MNVLVSRQTPQHPHRAVGRLKCLRGPDWVNLHGPTDVSGLVGSDAAAAYHLWRLPKLQAQAAYKTANTASRPCERPPRPRPLRAVASPLRF